MSEVPYSRLRQGTPWPIAAFNVMAKPAGAACNMSCRYCYYVDKCHTDGLGSAGVLPDAALERFVKQYIDSQDAPTIFFGWQGGEPTLAGLDFYRKVIAFQQKHARQGIAIINTFQTNGMLLDDIWCQFFAEHGFLVGISIDGPAEINDPERGEGNCSAACEAIRRLQKHGVTFNTLTTVNRTNVSHPEAVYQFLTGELGLTSLQFQPCVELKDHASVAPGCWPADTLPVIGSPQAIPGNADSVITDWSVSGHQWGEFLCRLFDAWWSNGVGRVNINLFHSWARQWVDQPASMCITSPVCGRCVVLESDGRLYSCDHYVFDEYCLGTVADAPGQTLSDLVRSSRQKQFGEAKSKGPPGTCRRCPFLFACYGECPKRRFVRTPDGELGLNYLCPGLRVFFDHAGSRLAQYGQQILRGATPHNDEAPVRGCERTSDGGGTGDTPPTASVAIGVHRWR